MKYIVYQLNHLNLFENSHSISKYVYFEISSSLFDAENLLSLLIQLLLTHLDCLKLELVIFSKNFNSHFLFLESFHSQKILFFYIQLFLLQNAHILKFRNQIIKKQNQILQAMIYMKNLHQI